jgi:hypothetical protein
MSKYYIQETNTLKIELLYWCLQAKVSLLQDVVAATFANVQSVHSGKTQKRHKWTQK